MKNDATSRKLLFAAAVLAASVLPLMMFADREESTVKIETLLRTSAAWDNIPYTSYPVGAPELTVLRITIPAHGE